MIHYQLVDEGRTACHIRLIPPGQGTTKRLSAEIDCGACRLWLLGTVPQPEPGSLDWETFLTVYGDSVPAAYPPPDAEEPRDRPVLDDYGERQGRGVDDDQAGLYRGSSDPDRPPRGELSRDRLGAAIGGPAAMRRRDWWIGIGIVAGILLLHALFPRYEDPRLVNGPSRVHRAA